MADYFDKLAAQQGVNAQSDLSQSTLDSKLNQLKQSRENKLQSLSSNVKTANLVGMDDADTFKLSNGANIRETAQTGRYDATELAHGESLKQRFGFNELFDSKSNYAEDKQVSQAANYLNKSEAEVTRQDLIDIGNMQQIQKLADLTRSQGQERWIAPYVEGVEQTNLTGQYVDDKGNDVSIPLDINIGVDTVASKDDYGRDLSSVYNVNTGENISNLHQQDKNMNAFAPDSEYSLNAKGDVVYTGPSKDKSIVEGTIDTAKAFGTSFIKELAVDTADFIGDATNLWDIGTEAEKTEMVNSWLNYDPKSVEEAQKKVSVLTNRIFDKDTTMSEKAGSIVQAVWTGVTTPELLGQSLGVIAAWVVPGTLLTKGKKISDVAGGLNKVKHAVKGQAGQISAALGNVNDQYETFVENNNGVELQGADKVAYMTKAFGIQMFNQNLDAITAVSIIKSPSMLSAAKDAITGASEKNFGKFLTGVGKTLGTTALNMPKEAAQEYTQRMMELTNERYGSEKFKDLDSFGKFLTDEGIIKEGTIDALLGAGGAVQFQAAGSALQGIGAIKDKVTTKIEETKAEVAQPTTEVKFTDVNTAAEKASNLRAASKSTDEATRNEVKTVATDLKAGKDTLNILGSTEDDIPTKIDRIKEIVEILSEGEGITPEEKANIVKLVGDKTGAEVSSVTAEIDKAEKIGQALKTLNQVSMETTEGTRGFNTYYANIKEAQKSKDTDKEQVNLAKLENFLANQDSKMKALKSIETDVMKEARSKARLLMKDAPELTEEQALYRVKQEYDKGSKAKLEASYGTNNNKIYMNKGVVVENFINGNKPDFNAGSYATYRQVEKELNAMENIYNEVTGKAAIGSAVDETETEIEVPSVNTKQPKKPITEWTDKELDAVIDRNQPRYDELVSKAAKGEITEKEQVVLGRFEKLLDIRDSRKPKVTKKESKLVEPVVTTMENPPMEPTEEFPIDGDNVVEATPIIEEPVAPTVIENPTNVTTMDEPPMDDIQYPIDDFGGYEMVEDFQMDDVNVMEDPTMIDGSMPMIDDIGNEMVERQTKAPDVAKVQKLTARKKELEGLLDRELDEDNMSDLEEELSQVTKSLTTDKTNASANVLDAGRVGRIWHGDEDGRKVVSNVFKVSRLTGLNVAPIVGAKAQVEQLTNVITAPTLTKDKTVNQNDFMNDPSRVFIYHKDGSVNTNVAVAIDAAVVTYFLDNFTNLTTPKTVEDIEEMFPNLTEEGMEQVEFKLMNGGGTLKFEAENLGAEIVSSLGITAGELGTETDIQALKASFGTVGLLIAADKGYINKFSKETGIPGSWFKDGNADAHTNLVTLKDFNAENLGEFKNKANGYEDVYGIEVDKSRNYRQTQPNSKRKVTVHNQPYTTATDVQAEAVILQEQMSYEINDGVDVLAEIFGDGVEIDAKALKERLGYKAESKKLSKTTNNKNKARNAEIDVQVDSLMDMIKTTGKQTKVWFNWFVTKGGRFNLDSTRVNPQTDKNLARWLVTALASVSIVKTDSYVMLKEIPQEADDKTVALAYGLVQAFDGSDFGGSFDKMSKEEVLTEASRILNADREELVEAVRSGADHVGHAAIGLSTIDSLKNAYANGEKSIKSRLSVEVDGLTNGFAFRVMQFPLDEFEKWLPKIGVLLEGSEFYDEFDDMGAVKSSGRLQDVYETLGFGFKEGSIPADPENKAATEIFNSLNKLSNRDEIFKNLESVGGKVAKAIRNLMKTPVMTFNYSAGMASIRRAVVRDEIIGGGYNPVGIIDKMLDGTIPDASLNVIAKSIGTNKETMLKNISEYDMKDKRNKVLMDNLSIMFDLLYGAPIQESLDKQFGGYIKLNKAVNTAYSTMYANFVRKYIDKLTEDSKNRDSKVFLLPTPERKIEIINELLPFAPSIPGPDSKSKDDVILVASRAIEDINNLIDKASVKSGKKGVHFPTEVRVELAEDKRGELNGSKDNASLHNGILIRGLGDPGSSGSVIPIHTSDGSAQGRTLLGMKKGYLGVHDAEVLGIDQVFEGVEEYNKNWYEINREYNILQEISDKLGRNIAVETNGISRMELMAAKAGIDEQLQIVNPNRKIIFGKNAKIGQMGGPKGSMYKVDIKQETAIIQQELETNMNSFKDMVSNLKSKDLRKQVIDIMKRNGCM